MKSFRRVLAGACVGLLAAPLLVTVAQADTAEPAASVDPAQATGTSVVTLLTGDKVHVTTYSDDAIAIDIEAAERPDGVAPVFSKQEYDGHTYVIPSDVAALVGDMLDPALFDVAELVESEYDDEHVDGIPVIIDYGTTAPSARARSAALPGVEVERALTSIGALAADIDKDDTDAFREALIAQASAPAVTARVATPTIEKIWLDARVEVQLEESVPQIGADEMWDAGYTGEGMVVAVLDSGIDPTHPDLAGKIVAEKNFSISADAVDHHGHGTHVASTIAGTGAASDGRFVGVAPDAQLLNGKVLSDYGSGDISQIIAGMEWAVANGADVVSMSVGSNGVWTDGSDPAAQAVNALSEESGVLFVIAAGNNGSAAGTISTPGSADAALTIGAVNDSDMVANFSGRGPRAGDYQLKPDVTAPGVGIIAARAAGTKRGTIFDDYYTAVSGTSMATPHVAGAAALLLQQHPELTGQQLKGLLSSTALLTDGTIWDQGTGRIDLTHASETTVLADSGSLSMGFFDYPQTETAAVTKSITYTNLGDADVTLDIVMDGIVDEQGAAPAEGMVTLHQDAVTVPAGGTATVDVTVDPKLGEPGVYAGYLTATDADGNVLRAGVGFAKEAERYDLVVTAFDRNGEPAGGQSTIDVINVDDRAIFAEPAVSYVDGVATFRVPAGHYSVAGVTFTTDEGGKYAVEETSVSAPEIYVDQDVAVELDARDAVAVDVETGNETEVIGTILAYQRKDAKGSPFSHTWSMTAPINTHSVLPTDAVETGSFEWYTSQTLRAPELQASVGDQDLTLRYSRLSERLDGEIATQFVDAGAGTPEEMAAAGVEGKIALVERTGNTFNAQVTAGAAAGAQAVVIYNNEPGLIMINGIAGKVPHMTLSQAEGEAIMALMTDGVVDVDIQAIAQSEYLYETMFPFADGIPADLDLKVTAQNSATVTANYRAQVEGVGIAETRHRWRPWEPSAFGLIRLVDAGMVRTEMITTDADTMWAHNHYINATPANPYGAYVSDTRHGYEVGTKVEENFQTAVIAPGFQLYGGNSATRTGNKVALSIPEWVDSDGHYGEWFYRSDSSVFRLYENGVQKAQNYRAKGTFTVGSEPAEYRIELDIARGANWWTMSTATSTAWTVQSAPEAGATEVLPLMRAELHPNVDLFNRVNGAAHYIDIDVTHQPGAVQSAIDEVKLWISVDDGTTWRETTVGKHGKDGLRAVINQLPQDAEFVSVRLEVTDVDGNKLEQQITRAYGLR